MLRVFFLLFCLLALFSFPVSAAQNPEVKIKGDEVLYQQEGKLVEARGNVSVYYKNLRLFAGEVFYYAEDKRVVARKGFRFKRKDVVIDGESLDYSLASGLGKGTEVEMVFDQNIFLRGKKVSVYPDKIELKEAAFNACGLHPPHYDITASEIVLYPEVGWVIASWGLFWYHQVPLLPIPTYLFDARAASRNRRNEPPFPELGSNDEDGNFIHQRFVWHGSDKWYGRFTLSYFSNKGLGAGVEGNYVLDSANEGNVRFFYNGVDRWYGGLTHYYAFGGGVNKDKKLELDTLLPWFSDSRYMLQTDLTYNERINYERISFLPSFTLFARNAPVGIYKLQNNWSVGWARIRELSSVLELNRLKSFLEYTWAEPLWQGARLVPAVWLDYSYYAGNQNWLRNMGRVSFYQNFAGLADLGLNYKHHFNIWGESPFNYERYHYQPLDAFGSELFFNLGTTRVGVRSSHYLPAWSAIDIDYIASTRWHCYGITLTYRSLRKEITFAFSLDEPR